MKALLTYEMKNLHMNATLLLPVTKMVIAAVS